MEQKQIERDFDNMIMTLIERVEVNQIVIISKMVDDNFKTKKELDEYLTDGKNKIKADSLILFNNVDKIDPPSHEVEIDDLRKVFNEGFEFLADKIDQQCQLGESLYEINEMIRNAVKVVDIQFDKLNYKDWFVQKMALISSDTFYVVVGHHRVAYPSVHFNFDTLMPQIDLYFKFRKNLLRELKYRLVDIFSKYLLLPDIEQLPVIKYHCNPIEICELIEALVTSKYFDDTKKLKTFFMEIFQVDRDLYKDKKLAIKKKQGNRSSFLLKLSDDFDSYVYPKNKKQ